MEKELINNNSCVNHIIREKRVRPVKVKTVDGSIFRGNYYFRPSYHRIKDDLNTTFKSYIALTDVVDQNGNIVGLTFLINFENISYIAVDDSDQEQSPQNGVVKQISDQILPKRRVKAVIRLVDGSILDCTIFVRNTLFQTADELNLKEDKYIVAVDVQEKKASLNDRSSTYFINKKQVICVAVADDDLLLSEESLI